MRNVVHYCTTFNKHVFLCSLMVFNLAKQYCVYCVAFQTVQPEDKLSAAIKEKLVASLVPLHEANEKAVNKRWKFEERVCHNYN